MKNQKPLFFLLGCFAFTVGFFMRSGGMPHISVVSDTPATIVFTSKGFTPARVTIRKGGNVTFTNRTDHPFWPASNLHPIHDEYPAFDPKKPIAASSSWSFTFDQQGVWGFHDHLFPQFEGTVVVVGLNEPAVHIAFPFSRPTFSFLFPQVPTAAALYDQCEVHPLAGVDHYTCWRRAYNELMERYGVDATMNTLETLKHTYPTVAVVCHNHADFIGELSYWWEVRHGKQFHMTKFMRECSLGFLHGYLSELVSHGKNYKRAQAFCDKAMRDAGGDGEIVARECARGIGNGLSFLYVVQYWNNVEEIIRRSSADCAYFAHPDVCIEGLFGGLDHMNFGIHGYRLTMDKNDPFGQCKSVSKDIEYSCYSNIIPSVFALLGYDIDALVSHIAAIANDKTAQLSMQRVMGIPFQLKAFTARDYEATLTTCRGAGDRLWESCLWGFLIYLDDADTQSGGTTRYLATFCALPMVNKKEQDLCSRMAHHIPRSI